MMTEILYGTLKLLPILCLTLFSFIPLISKMLNNNKEPSPLFLFGVGFLSLFFSLLSLLVLGFKDGQVLTLRFDFIGSGAWCRLHVETFSVCPFNKRKKVCFFS